MAKLVWDQVGERYYETGASKAVLYPQENGKYPKGTAWNGLTAVTESPGGAEPNDLYADDIKYATLRSAETFGGTIEAYTYPDEFGVCDGTATPETTKGLLVGQQPRKSFGLSYVTKVGNDTTDDAGYKIHLVYGATASPSEKSFATINDSPEAITFSWEFTTTPVAVEGFKPCATLVIDSRDAEATKLAALEEKLYGGEGENADPQLPLPDEVISMFKTTGASNTVAETSSYGKSGTSSL